jgi:cell division inhibitor SepF
MGFLDGLKRLTGAPTENTEDIESGLLETYVGNNDTKIVDDIESVEEENAVGTFNREDYEEANEVQNKSNYISPVIRKPTSVHDCEIIAQDIKEGKLVVINIAELGKDEAQKVMDFVSGAMGIKNAKFNIIGKDVFCVVPEGCIVESEGEEERKIIDIEN